MSNEKIMHYSILRFQGASVGSSVLCDDYPSGGVHMLDLKIMQVETTIHLT